MVKGTEDGTYKGLKERFDRLVKPSGEIGETKSTDLNSILEVFAKRGLSEAMELFKKNK